jgi:uncharacterized protein YeaO (DUF488 family)
MIRVKSIYDPAADDDAFRVLADPVWPKKVSREKTVLNVWLRDLAPSPGLYDLYSRGQLGWNAFVVLYHGELERNRDFSGTCRTITKTAGSPWSTGPAMQTATRQLR